MGSPTRRTAPVSAHTPAYYRIRVEGQLGPAWSDWFEGQTLTYTESGDTILAGPVVDQAALHGLLMKLRDLNVTLVALERVEPG